MGMPDAEEQSYEANTVEELRDELRARNLPVSGHKDELIARLEEDDAAQEGGEEVEEQEAGEEAEEQAVVEEEIPVNAISPFQLPANTAAAQAILAGGQVVVDDRIQLPDEARVAAQEAIIDYGDPDNDFRMEGYVAPTREEEEQQEEPVPEEAK